MFFTTVSGNCILKALYMEEIKTTKKSEDFKDEYEKFRLNYALTLECARILPWELDVSTMKISNIFGLNILFSEGEDNVDFQKWLDMINSEDKTLILPSIQMILDGTVNDISIDYRLKKISGELLWVKTIAKIRKKTESGKPAIINGINQDVTESKLLEIQNLNREKKIRDSESRLKNAMKLGRMSPWEYSYETGGLISDRLMTAMWDFNEYYDRGEAPTIDVLARSIHPEDRSSVLQKFKHSVENQENFEMSFRLLVRGSVKFINFIGEVTFDGDGRASKMVGIAQDITQMKSLEKTLATQYQGLRFIAEKAGIGLWEFNTRENYIYTITGDETRIEPGSIFKKISVEEFMKRIHPEDLTMFQTSLDFYSDIVRDVTDLDMRVNIENDVFRWFHITAVIDQIDDSGRPLKYKGLYQDISERKEIEGRLYQSQKMEAVGRLAGGIAHDFNNILQVILGYGSLALMDAESNSDMLENISHIVDSGEKARSLVRQLLLFARREKFRPSPVALNDLVSGFIKMLKRVIGENITLSFNPDPGLNYIHGDAGQLEQIFMNLCINSRDAIDSNHDLNGSGSIIIKTQNTVIDEYWPCFDNRIPPGSYVMFSVADTGIGIPSESIDQVFEPFFTTKDKNRGTGLGLATVYSIVKQHRGYLDVHSIEGNGTKFSLYFPVYSHEISSPVNEENEPAGKHFTGDKTVLLAEDDDLIRKYTERILIDSGYIVITAEDGERAVELFNLHRDEIDFLIFDVVMPKKNGWDVYNEIGGVEKKIPVIFFSGYDQNLLPANASETVNMIYVQKPFKYYTMIKAIHDLLDRNKA